MTDTDFLADAAGATFVVPDHKASKDDAPPKSTQDNRARFFNGRQTDRSKPRNERTRTYKPAPDYHKGKYVAALEEMYGGLAAILAPFHQECGCAQVIAAQAESCAQSVDTLAGEYPAVRRALEGGSKFGAIVGVAIAHAPIVAVVATSHTPIAQRLYARMGHEHAEDQHDNG